MVVVLVVTKSMREYSVSSLKLQIRSFYAYLRLGKMLENIWRVFEVGWVFGVVSNRFADAADSDVKGLA